MGFRPVYAGLHIGSRSLALAVLERHQRGYRLNTAQIAELPSGLIQPSPASLNISDPGEFQLHLQRLLEPYQVFKRISLSLPDPAVRAARLSLPPEPIRGNDLENWMRWQMEKVFLSPLANARVVHQFIPSSRKGVLAVTIQHDILEQYEEAVRRLGIEPIWANISSFQLFNFYHDLILQLAGPPGRFMVLNLFDHNFTFMIFMQGVIDFIRIKGLVPVSTDHALSDLIMHELNASLSFYSQVQDPSVVTHLFVFGRKMSEIIKKAHDQYHLEVEPLEPERLTFLKDLTKVRPEEIPFVTPAIAAAMESPFWFQRVSRP
jgi:Tfp pilus assembly PilM family ATPase